MKWIVTYRRSDQSMAVVKVTPKKALRDLNTIRTWAFRWLQAGDSGAFYNPMVW